MTLLVWTEHGKPAVARDEADGEYARAHLPRCDQIEQPDVGVGRPADDPPEVAQRPLRHGRTVHCDEDPFLFCDDPDAVIRCAVEAGATARSGVRDTGCRGVSTGRAAFIDPFGHMWFVGDRSPLKPFPRRPEP